MKKILLILVLIVYKLSAVYAQGLPITSTSIWNSIFNYENIEQRQNKAAGVKEKKMVSNRSVIQYKYDTAGRLTDYRVGRKTELKTSYTEDGQKNFLAYYKRGNLIELDSFVWEGKLLKECDAIDDEHKIFNRQRYKYDSNYVTEYVNERMKHGKFVERKKQVTEYYPDYSLKRITFYKKGKPQYFTVFDCNPAGQNHKVEKDSSYNCVKEEMDSLGNKIRITITNERNISWKEVEYFNEKNERTADKTYDLKKNGELMWAYYYRPGLPGQFEKFVSYKRGKEFYRRENKFDEKGRIIEHTTSNHGKLTRLSKNTFNERDLITKTESYNRHNKLKWVNTFSYEYY